MKPAQESSTIVITSARQRQLIEQLAEKHLEEGGSILAQAFPDGFRLRVLTPAQTNELQQALSQTLGQPVNTHIVGSVFHGLRQGGAA